MAELLLFPLPTVLLPGASLGLRVFEARYLDLVSECSRDGRGFGICLQSAGSGTGAARTPAGVGTEALIEDFGSGRDGVLTLRVRGARRFDVSRTRVRENGLVVGEVEWLPPDPDDELRPEHGLLGTLLMHILDKVGGEYARAPSTRLDDAAWVGWRLAELLPISDEQRHALLQEQDPHARLDRLLALVPE
ncbi:MAG TPA: LON peptidase substrate-binding domain-containing protein [Xanthomonadaceae bacterium]|nr:LON peptidase substrate-binding domain-containing protein [Xanthomonadaceae bacterium]